MNLGIVIDLLIAILITLMIIKMFRMHKGLTEIMRYVLYKEDLEGLQNSRKKVDEKKNAN